MSNDRIDTVLPIRTCDSPVQYIRLRATATNHAPQAFSERATRHATLSCAHGSRQKFQRKRRCEPTEEPAIGRTDATNTEHFADGDDRRVDEADIEIFETATQIGNTRECVARQIDNIPCQA
jgi:hypothetical protein